MTTFYICFTKYVMWNSIEGLSQDLKVRFLKNTSVHTSTFSEIGLTFLLPEYIISCVLFSVFIGWILVSHSRPSSRLGQLLSDSIIMISVRRLL